MTSHTRKITVALVQFDAAPEQTDDNLAKMAARIEQAAGSGARWILFHESTVCDCTPRLAELAEPVPDGTSTRRMLELAARHDCVVSFGLAEVDAGRYYITQAFVGPEGPVHRCRKTWLWREPTARGYRNEWARYDPGTGPDRFTIDGVRATCFICADGEAPRCIQRAKELRPQVVFYPNNRERLPDPAVFGRRAKEIGAPMLVTNRVGKSWDYDCLGGCAVYSAAGELLASADRTGREEILLYDLDLGDTD